MPSPLPFLMSLIFIVLALISPGLATQPTTTASSCLSKASQAGSHSDQWDCGNGGGGNTNGTNGTVIVPRSEPTKLKRQNLPIQNLSLFIQEHPYQASPYYKPAAVLRGCTGSIITTFDTEDANLNGRGQTVVSQRQSCGSTGPIELFSGLGKSVQIVQEDLFIDGWLVHISDG
jgi:hypothetical protein